MEEYVYHVVAPSWFLHRGRDALLEDYLHSTMFRTAFQNRLDNEDGEEYAGFFKGIRKRKELMKEVQQQIYGTFNHKINSINKWNEDIEIPDPDNEDFNKIIVKAESELEAMTKLNDVLSELDNFLSRYGIDEKVHCYSPNWNVIFR